MSQIWVTPFLLTFDRSSCASWTGTTLETALGRAGAGQLQIGCSREPGHRDLGDRPRGRGVDPVRRSVRSVEAGRSLASTAGLIAARRVPGREFLGKHDDLSALYPEPERRLEAALVPQAGVGPARRRQGACSGCGAVARDAQLAQTFHRLLTRAHGERYACPMFVQGSSTQAIGRAEVGSALAGSGSEAGTRAPKLLPALVSVLSPGADR
jgi:hypothetical protein